MIEIVSDIALALLGVAVAITLVRLVRGPTAADRIVALDLLTLLGIALIAAFAFRAGISLYVEVAAGLCAVGFVSTLAFARYLIGSARP